MQRVGTMNNKMAFAMVNAVKNCVNEGRNPGRIGSVVVTIAAKYNLDERQRRPKAVSAVKNEEKLKITHPKYRHLAEGRAYE